MDEQVLILGAQANKAANRVSRVRKLARRWVEDVWVHGGRGCSGLRRYR
jgi:hypothetical protein